MVPIYKKGDPSNIKNYRPVSLLPSLSKVFERAIYNRLYKYFDTFNILSKHQYEFLPRRSTELAIYNTVTYIMENLDKNIKIAGIYFDLSKAFDSINQTTVYEACVQICSNLICRTEDKRSA